MVDEKYKLEVSSISALIEEGIKEGIFERHLQEVGYGTFSVNVAPAKEQLQKQEDELNYACFTVRERSEDKLVGYVGTVISEHVNYKDRIAQMHAIYIDPAHRGYGLATTLIKFIESQLYHSYGCRFIQLASNTNNPIGKLFERVGYRATDIIYTKEFQDYED